MWPTDTIEPIGFQHPFRNIAENIEEPKRIGFQHADRAHAPTRGSRALKPDITLHALRHWKNPRAEICFRNCRSTARGEFPFLLSRQAHKGARIIAHGQGVTRIAR
jgi:hypothetical protein